MSNQKDDKVYFYVLTGIRDFIHMTRSHCLGIYTDLSTLEEHIKKYPENIFDNDHNYLVIEKVPEGIEPYDTIEVKWFEYKNGRYVETDKPFWAHGVCCWVVS